MLQANGMAKLSQSGFHLLRRLGEKHLKTMNSIKTP
jgi:hypothetical protein